MSNIILFGGSGKVARHITRLLAAEGHTIHSIIRKPDQNPTSSPSAATQSSNRSSKPPSPTSPRPSPASKPRPLSGRREPE
ncbi:hypothetical protein LTR01_002584 [Friedmanniomyces endolithicus]|nr:hypothetical protein LTR01_002584 [Friedmanniomyces endolithicus]